MSTLYLIATPIGNLEDISTRALRLLEEVDYIACEDTRTSGRLMKYFDISTPMFSFHAHNEHFKVNHMVDLLNQGKAVALISDAGTPAISDPGYLAVKSVLEAGHTVCPIPGASAAIAALSASGLPTDRFVFEGFLPHKKGRQTRILALLEEERTTIFYESPFRVVKLLKEFVTHLGGQRQVVLARELTKTFEEFRRGTAEELLALAEADQLKIKGEFVVLLEGVTKKNSAKK